MEKGVQCIIYGAGGHAKVVADILWQQKLHAPTAFVDDKLAGGKLMGLPIISTSDFYQNPKLDAGIVALGDNFIRGKIVTEILAQKKSFHFIFAQHPSAIVARDCQIAEGSVLMAGSILNPFCQVGRHCILNTASILDHDGQMEDFSSLAPGAKIGGGCKIGTYSAVGIGASVSHGLVIGAHSVIGGGSFVNDDVIDHMVAFGVPCRLVRKRAEGDQYL